jgi:hypothetical protein
MFYIAASYLIRLGYDTEVNGALVNIKTKDVKTLQQRSGCGCRGKLTAAAKSFGAGVCVGGHRLSLS